MMHQVFISYANDKGTVNNRDFQVAETICNALEAKKIRCWMAPRDIKGGDNWTEAILKAVKKSRLVVLVFSSNANQSDGVKDEIHLARDKKIKILPFRIENIPATGVLEFVILRYQCIDAFKSQPQDYIDELVKAVQEHLGHTQLPPQSQKLIPNPFIDTLAIHDLARFIGREAEMRRLMTLLQVGSVALHGEPKVGKSSLMLHLARTWNGNVLGPLDCQSLKDQADFYDNIALALKLDRYDRQTIRSTLNSSHILCLLDELDVGPERGITHTDLALLRSVCDRNRDFKMVAASRSHLKEVFPDTGIGSPVYNFLIPFTLGTFTESEAQLLLNHPWVPDAPFFDADTSEQLLELTGFHPYKLQRAAFHCFEILVNPEYDWQSAIKKDIEQMALGTNSQKVIRTFQSVERKARVMHDTQTLHKPPTKIAQKWRQIISKANGVIGEEVLRQTIKNPYEGSSGLPVTGSTFTGRADIIRKIETHQAAGGLRVLLILYGHRRMGKTSILHDLSNRTGSNTLYIYLDMQNVGWVDHTGELLLDFAEAIHRAAAEAGVQAGPPLEEAKYTNLGTGRRSLNSLLNKLDPQMTEPKRLVLAIDEFELIETGIKEKRIDAGLLPYLRSLNQSYPWLGLIFAGLHTLDEMGRDYWATFYGQAEYIRVGYMEYNDALRLITQPHPDFALEYAPELREELYRLTAGQPYLIQRLCWELVTRWNECFLKQGESTPRILTLDDLEPVLTPDFFHSAGYYFDGVWSNVTENERTLMRIMAQRDKGTWTLAELAKEVETIPSFKETKTLEETIDLLRRHDVIAEEKEGTRIASELLRRWLCQ